MGKHVDNIFASAPNDPVQAMGLYKLSPDAQAEMSETDFNKALLRKYNIGGDKSILKRLSETSGGPSLTSPLSLGNVGGSFGEKERMGLLEYGKGIKDILSSETGIAGLWKIIGGAEEQAIEYGREEQTIRNNINSAMSVTGILAYDIRNDIMQSAKNALIYGYSIKDITDEYKSLNAETGRFNILSTEILQQSFVTARELNMTLDEMGSTFAEFQKVGIGYRDTIDDLDKIAKKSLELGLSGAQTVKDVRDNLSLLNQYGFSNGVQGLAQMSRIAKEFRIDLKDAMTIADNVMSPEKAIDLSAQLQALGGAIGEFTDPFKLLYDSTNNVEGLQTALVGLTKDLATYNEKTGAFEVTGANLRKAKEMAAQLNIPLTDITKSAKAAQERMQGLQDISIAPFRNISGEEKDFLLNLAHMEHGEMMISIPENLRTTFEGLGKTGYHLDSGMANISQMTMAQYNLIKQYQDQFKTLSPEDIAKNQFTEIQQISNNVAAITSFMRVTMADRLKATINKSTLNSGYEAAAGFLNLNNPNLLKSVQSGVDITGKAADFLKEGLNMVSFGMFKEAKNYFDKADTEQQAIIKKNEEAGRAINMGRAALYQNTDNSYISSQDVLYGNTRTENRSRNIQDVNFNINYNVKADGNFPTEIGRALHKNLLAKDMYNQQENAKSYLNQPEMFGAGK